METRYETFDEMIAAIRSYAASTGHTVPLYVADDPFRRMLGYANYDPALGAEEPPGSPPRERWLISLTRVKEHMPQGDYRLLIRTSAGRAILAEALSRGVEAVFPDHLRAVGEQLALPL